MNKEIKFWHVAVFAIVAIWILFLMTGCTTFSIEAPDGTSVSGTSCFTDFDGVYGEWPSGGWFELTGAKTQAELIVEAFQIGLTAGAVGPILP